MILEVPSENALYASHVFVDAAAAAALYTLSLHDALPICAAAAAGGCRVDADRGGSRADQGTDGVGPAGVREVQLHQDRKSTRLNSSHEWTSYAVFCWKKKKGG